jgi:hypothetical protein
MERALSVESLPILWESAWKAAWLAVLVGLAELGIAPKAFSPAISANTREARLTPLFPVIDGE